MFRVSTRTATYDFLKLVELKLIEKEGIGSATRYVLKQIAR